MLYQHNFEYPNRLDVRPDALLEHYKSKVEEDVAKVVAAHAKYTKFQSQYGGPTVYKMETVFYHPDQIQQVAGIIKALKFARKNDRYLCGCLDEIINELKK